MIDSMQSPWQPADFGVRGERSGERHPEQHVLLGQILERSTSAPPISTEDLGFGRQRSGGDGGKFLFDVSERSDETLFGSGGGRDSAPLNNEKSSSTSILLAGIGDGGGRASVPSVAYSQDSLPGSSNGHRLGSTRSSSVGPYNASDEFGIGRETEHIGFGDLPSRSRSAAPSLLPGRALGPPPGLGEPASNHDLGILGGNRRYSSNQSKVGIDIRRPASAGVLPGSGLDLGRSSAALSSLGIDNDLNNIRGREATVRPAAIKPLDWIKESNFPPHELGYARPQTAAPYLEGPEPDSFAAHRPRSVSPPRSHSVLHFPPDEQHQPLRLEPIELPRRMQIRGSASPSDGLAHELDRLSINQRGPEQQIQVLEKPRALDVPQQAQYRGDRVHRGQETTHRQRPTEPQQHRQQQQAPMYAPVHPTPHQAQPRHVHHGHPQSHPMYESQPPIYAYGGQPSPHHQPVDMAQSSIQVLPNGQAVYVTPAPYTYMQYHPHQHILHQSAAHDQYISVVPVRSPPQGQITYWQRPDGGIAPVIMTQPAPHMMGTGVPDQQHELSGHSRSKRIPREGGGRGNGAPDERGGGRGRRGGGGNNGGAPGMKQGTRSAVGSAPTSKLLEDFRATKSREWTIYDIKGHIVEFCQDQNGSRFIQQRLELANSQEQQIVVAEVLPAIRQLRNDVFGNYVVQKLLDFGTSKVKSDIRDTLTGEMLSLSLQMYGCRVVQKALETLEEEDLPRLLLEFEHNVLSCIHDQNGNHVVQKCIEVMSTKSKQASAIGDTARANFFSGQIDFVIKDVLDNVVALSCHPYGCRVLQRILEHCIDDRKNSALDAIRPCHQVLLDDCFGNYVVQHVICYGRSSDRDSILAIVVESGLLALSKQKFASNVVEKLLKYGSGNHRNAIVREMLKKVDDASLPGDMSSSVVLLMVRDAYANYVVQTALDVVPEGAERNMLLEELNSHSEQLRNYTFAKHIVTKLSS